MTAPILKMKELIPRDRLDLGHTQTGIDHGNSIRLFTRHGKVPPSDPLMKVKWLGLDPIPRRQSCAKSRRSIAVNASSAPRQSDPRVEIQQDGQIRDKPIGAESAQPPYQVVIDASPNSLVRQRGIGETVAQHHCPSREGGSDHLPDKLRAAGLIQQ